MTKYCSSTTVATLRHADLVIFGLALVLEAFKVFQDDLVFFKIH